jgi:periplasmic protein TonB
VPSYQGTADRPDKAKAIVAVAAVHAALAAVILSGLKVQIVTRAVDQLTTFNLRQPPPPPPVRPRPVARTQLPKRAEGAPAKSADATQVVAPPAMSPVPSPVAAAPLAGAGSAPNPGASAVGAGTGSSGNGFGQGGNGTGAYLPARKLTKIPDSQYRRLAASGIASGSVAVTIRVNADGSVSNCKVVRSSGSPYADSLMCDLTLRYVRFSPARDPSGRPVAQQVTWVPTWAPR